MMKRYSKKGVRPLNEKSGQARIPFRGLTPFTVILLMMAMLPGTAWAAFTFIWSPPQGDQSIILLGDLFGNVGSVLTGSNTLIGSLFYIFNIAVLSIGSIVVSYTIILSTMNTAQEGEVMGRKWSSIWIPLRCAIGMGFLLPTASGYSLVQVLMMQIVLYGVAAADQLWSVALNTMGTAQGLTGNISVNQNQLQETTQKLFDSMVCQEVLNNNPTCQIAMSGRKTTVYTTTNNSVMIGIQGDPSLSNVCGSYQAGGVPAGVDLSSWQAANLSALTMATTGFLAPAAELYMSPNPSTWTNGANIQQTIGNAMTTIITSAAATNTPTDNSQSSTTANNGWLYAGSYYFEINRAGPIYATYPPPVATGDVGNSSLGTECSIQLSNYRGLAAQYLQSGQSSGPPSSSGGGGLQLQPANISQSEAMAFYNEICQPIQGLVYNLLNYLTLNDSDPISSLRQVGLDIMNTAENIWFTVMILGFLILIGACFMSGTLPFCYAFGAIISLLIPILTIILILLWTAGVTIGIYLPLVPYLVFTFTALSWFILVIEAIAAAPIVALGLVSPAAEELGKAAPAVMIITSVFLRPSLMVIGFMIAINLVQATISMVNYGFAATLKASTGSLGLFSLIAVICIYGGMVITIIHECFSLIYVLPDKIIRWIGGSAEQSSVKSSVQEVKGAAEKGAEIGSSMMKGSASVMEEKVGQKLGKGEGDKPSSGGLSLGGDGGGSGTGGSGTGDSGTGGSGTGGSGTGGSGTGGAGKGGAGTGAGGLGGGGLPGGGLPG
jgi:defect in organelle trafficking protein DotA